MATVLEDAVACASRPPDSGSLNTDSLSIEDEEGWEDVEQEPDNHQPIVSLFDTETFPDVLTMLEYCKQKHDFDFLKTTQELGLDFYGLIKLVNYIRSEVKAGNKHVDIASAAFLEGDKYLRPVLEGDALLFSLDDLPGDHDSGDKMSQSDALLSRVAELEGELQRLRLEYADYKLGVMFSSLEGSAGATPAPAAPSDGLKAAVTDESKSDDDSHYFTSYSHNDIHETMLKDTIRTDAYRDFIYENKNLFADKVVLDVGCGTGILSMFCAKAGAKKVIAVDNSDIINKAREIIFENKLGDVITCVRGKIEEVTLPVPKVDIIISEWMGYCLLYEAMLDSVIWARDRYLAPDGLMVPSHCALHIAPVYDPDYVADRILFWHSVYGFSMTGMITGMHKEVNIRHHSPSTVVGSSSLFLQLPLHTITSAELNFDRAFESAITEDSGGLDGFIIWFDTFFLPTREGSLSADAKAEIWEGEGVAFTTGPAGKETHWQQASLFKDWKEGPRPVLEKGGKVKGRIGYKKQAHNLRELGISVEWEVSGSDGKTVEQGKQLWTL